MGVLKASKNEQVRGIANQAKPEILLKADKKLAEKLYKRKTTVEEAVEKAMMNFRNPTQLSEAHPAVWAAGVATAAGIVGTALTVRGNNDAANLGLSAIAAFSPFIGPGLTVGIDAGAKQILVRRLFSRAGIPIVGRTKAGRKTGYDFSFNPGKEKLLRNLKLVSAARSQYEENLAVYGKFLRKTA